MLALQRILTWILGVAGIGWLLLVFIPRLFNHISREERPGFVRIENGWIYLVVALALLILIIWLVAYFSTAISNKKRNRARPYWPTFFAGINHLLLWGFLLFAYYPILQILAASFDPTNSLYKLLPPDTDSILLRSRVIPDFASANLDNYTALFTGARILAYQYLLFGLLLVALLIIFGLAAYRKTIRDGEETPLARWHSRLLLILGLLVLLVVISLSPSQFAGQTTESKFLLWVRNTLLLSGLTGALTVFLTATAGYAFARFSFPGRYQTLLVFIFIQMFPGFLGLIAIYKLMSDLGLLDPSKPFLNFVALLLAYSGGVISFGTWVYKGFLESVPKSLEEASAIDGATKWQTFTKILIPLSMPLFVFIFLLQFVGTYSEFILANIFLSGVDSWTIGLGLRNFTQGQFSNKWGLFAAVSVLGSLPILAVFYGFQRYFVSGYTAGGVKE